MVIDIVGLLELVAIGAEVVDAINALIDLLTITEEPSYADLTLEQKTFILKRCTKIVANLDVNLACYPMGYTTAILFDEDGNPVP